MCKRENVNTWLEKKNGNTAFAINCTTCVNYEWFLVFIDLLFQDDANFGNNIFITFIVCVVTL